MQKVKKAVVLAGGYGSRFMPFTKSVSKVMLPIIDTPAIQMVVNEAFESNIEQVLIIVGNNARAIINHFKPNKQLEKRFKNNPEYMAQLNTLKKYKVSFKRQRVLNGTANAVLMAKRFIGNEPFLLMFSDGIMKYENKPASLELIEAFEKSGKNILGCKTMTREEATLYGVVEYSVKNGRTHEVSGIVEKPKLNEVKSTLCALERYVLTPEIFKHAKEVATAPNGERYLSHAFLPLIKQGKVLAYDMSATRYDTGNKLGYIKATTDYALSHPEWQNEYLTYLKEKLKS